MELDSYSIKKDLEPFSKISYSGLGSIILEKSDSFSIEVQSKMDIVDHILFEIRKEQLYVRMKDPVEVGLKSLLALKMPDIQVIIRFETLNEIIHKGVGKIFSRGVLELPELTVENRGVGEMSLNVSTGKLRSTLEGVGNLSLSGKASQHDCHLTGTGKIEAHHLHAVDCNVVSNGVGSVEVYASESIKAELKGMGKIVYHGQPKNVQSKINGMGSIVPAY